MLVNLTIEEMKTITRALFAADQPGSQEIVNRLITIMERERKEKAAHRYQDTPRARGVL
jgi:hypothetical protein